MVWTVDSTGGTSWCWKSLFMVKDNFLPLISCVGNVISFDGRRSYLVKHGYLALRGSLASFSQEVAASFLTRLKLQGPCCEWRDWMVKITRGKTELARARRKWLAALVYDISQERNSRIFKGCTPSALVSLGMSVEVLYCVVFEVVCVGFYLVYGNC
ncbi:hypothetical protein Dimus_014702 [Dionaea muscipula]